MLEAVVRTRNEPLALAATLGPLVKGVVEGLLATAVLVAEAPDEPLRQIADAAGCRLVEAPWAAGFAEVARGGSPLLVIDCGVVLAEGFWPHWRDVGAGIAGRPAATRAHLPFGMSAFGAAGAKLIRRIQGSVSTDEALILPSALAAALARDAVDPFARIYGPALVRLKAGSFRIGLATP